jgi:hypothetical protein
MIEAEARRLFLVTKRLHEMQEDARQPANLPAIERQIPTNSTAQSESERRCAAIKAYKDECAEHGVKVTDAMIAIAASNSWHDRTPVTWWKRVDPRSTPSADRAIRRVLSEKPHLPKA